MSKQSNTLTWKAIIAKYQKQSMARGIWQIVNTLVPYVALWVMMYYAMNISYWLLLPLIVLAGGFLVRVFIIFHDCGHSSFFKSQKANHILGSILGYGIYSLFPVALGTCHSSFHFRQFGSSWHWGCLDHDRQGIP